MQGYDTDQCTGNQYFYKSPFILIEHTEIPMSVFQLHRDVVARIVRSIDGGPIRRILKSSATKPTGTFVSVKGGYRAMPWESMRCELPTLEICEIASPVVKLLAQPHRLELFVRRQAKPLIYFPDLELDVEPEFYHALMRGRPFGEAALVWRPGGSRHGAALRTLVIEVKDDDDPRIDDPEYLRKLQLAKTVYGKLGIGFLTIVKSNDLTCIDRGLVRELTLERFNDISPVDVDRVMSLYTHSRATRPLGEIVQALGGVDVGKAKAATLHVSRLVSIDLRRGLRPDAPVCLLGSAVPADLPIAA